MWDFEKGKLLTTFVGHQYTVWSLEYEPSKHRLFSASSDYGIKVSFCLLFISLFFFFLIVDFNFNKRPRQGVECVGASNSAFDLEFPLWKDLLSSIALQPLLLRFL